METRILNDHRRQTQKKLNWREDTILRIIKQRYFDEHWIKRLNLPSKTKFCDKSGDIADETKRVACHERLEHCGKTFMQ